jgi:hypothetical protein
MTCSASAPLHGRTDASLTRAQNARALRQQIPEPVITRETTASVVLPPSADPISTYAGEVWLASAPLVPAQVSDHPRSPGTSLVAVKTCQSTSASIGGGLSGTPSQARPAGIPRSRAAAGGCDQRTCPDDPDPRGPVSYAGVNASPTMTGAPGVAHALHERVMQPALEQLSGQRRRAGQLKQAPGFIGRTSLP